MSIRAKLITLLLVFVLPTIGLMVIFYSRMVSAYQVQAISFQNSATQMAAGKFKDLVFEARNSLHTATRYSDRFLGNNGCPEFLDQTVEESGLFHYLVAVDLNGKVFCNSLGFDPQTFVASIPAYHLSIRNDDFAISEIPFIKAGARPDLAMAYPFRDKTGKASGVLLGVFDPDSLSKKLADSSLPEGAEVYLFDTEWSPLYTSVGENQDLSKDLVEKVNPLDHGQSIVGREITIRSKDNIKRVFRFAALDVGFTVMVGVGFPEGKFITESQQFVGGNIGVISILTLAILIVAYGGIESSLMKPLTVLTQSADALASGNLSVRTNLGHQKDEIGRLGQIFDRMAESLQENRANLEMESSAKLASQEKFFRLFEDSILGIFEITNKNRLVEANSALANMFGYSSEEEMFEIVNGPIGSLFMDDMDNGRIIQVIQNRQPVQMEINFRKKDGTPFIGNLHMWGVWNAAGEMESMEGFVEDITTSKNTQNQLTKLSQAVEQNPIGIVITDGVGQIEYANQGMVKVFGYEPGELIGQPINILVPETVQPEELDILRQAMRNGSTYRGEMKNRKKSGEPFWERYVLSPMKSAEGKTVNTLCLLEDITEQFDNKARITQQVEELSALRTIDLAISSNLDLLATLNIIANLAVKQLKVDAVCIHLYDARFHMLHTAVHSGFLNDLPEDVPFPAAADLSDWELVEEFSIHIPDNLIEKKASHRLSFPADDRFAACFGLPLVAKAEVKGLFRVFLKNPMSPEQHWLDFFYNLAAQTAIAMDNYELFRNLKQSNMDLLQAYDTTIEGWSRALNYRDAETEDHSVRTTRWTIELAREMGYPTEELVHIRRGALLHDIGKVAVPDNILNKPGPLTDDEWVVMRQHPQAAHDVLAPIQFLNKSLDIPFCHHERWNGMGYPRGLKGQEIPLGARIFSVIDVYDALTSDRPYRPAWAEEKVINYLREQSGIQFDPAVVEAFLSLLEKQKVI
jgi:PAS domain S-box-containing protein/putative nucleotidyltransferase with HDIG domain